MLSFLGLVGNAHPTRLRYIWMFGGAGEIEEMSIIAPPAPRRAMARLYNPCSIPPTH